MRHWAATAFAATVGLWAGRGPTVWKHVEEDWWLFRVANASVGAGQWSRDGRAFVPVFCQHVPGLQHAVALSDWDFCKRLRIASVAFYDPAADHHRVVVLDEQGARDLPEATSQTPIQCTRVLWSHQQLCIVSLSGTVRLLPLRETHPRKDTFEAPSAGIGVVRSIMKSHNKVYVLTIGKTWFCLDLDTMKMDTMRAPFRLPHDTDTVLCHAMQPMWKGIEQHRVLFLTSAPDKSVHLSEWRLHDREGWTLERNMIVWWMPTISTVRFAALSALGLWTVVVEMPRYIHIASGCWEQNRTETRWSFRCRRVAWGGAGPSSLRPVALLSEDGRWWRHELFGDC